MDVAHWHDAFRIGGHGWLKIAAAAGTQMFSLRLEPAENPVFLIGFRDLHRPAFGASHHDFATRLESGDLVVGGDGLQ